MQKDQKVRKDQKDQQLKRKYTLMMMTSVLMSSLNLNHREVPKEVQKKLFGQKKKIIFKLYYVDEIRCLIISYYGYWLWFWFWLELLWLWSEWLRSWLNYHSNECILSFIFPFKSILSYLLYFFFIIIIIIIIFCFSIFYLSYSTLNNITYYHFWYFDWLVTLFIILSLTLLLSPPPSLFFSL